MRKTKRRSKNARSQPVRRQENSMPVGSVKKPVAPVGEMLKPALPVSPGSVNELELRPLELRERVQAPPTGPDSTYLDLECLADIIEEPLEPLWGSVVSRAAVTVLAGEPGIGKSFVALDIAAAVTRGELGPRKKRDGVSRASDLTGLPPSAAPAPVHSMPDTSRQSVPGVQHDLDTLHTTADAKTVTGRGTSLSGKPQGVLICSPHYERSSILRRRLVDANADLSLIQTINGVRQTQDFGQHGPCWSFQLDRDLAIFEQELMLLQGDETDIGLVVIDPFPFGVSVGGVKQTRLLQEVTTRLAEIASLYQVAVLLVCDALPLEDSKRAASITAYPAVESVAQSVWVVERDQQTPHRRLLLPVKLANEAAAAGLAFTWYEGAVDWEIETVSMTAREFRARALQQTRNPLILEDASELGRAKDWLQCRLTDGPVQSNLIRREADDNEISYATLRRAFCALRIESTRIKNTRHHAWSAADGPHVLRTMGLEGESLSRPPQAVCPRRTTGLENESLSRDVGFEKTMTGCGQADSVSLRNGGFAEATSCVCATSVAEAATDATRNSAEEDVAVQVRAHDEHVLEHQFERVFDSVNHGVSSDFGIGVQHAQRELELCEVMASK